MKTIEQFLSDFQNLDVQLWVEDEKLRYSAPKETLTSELKTQLRERKLEIIEFLQTTHSVSSAKLETIAPVPRNTDLPLSFAQARLWFLAQLEPDNPFYNEQVAIQLNGSLDVAAIAQSLNEILRRHEALRTTFKILEGQPVQAISPNLKLTLPEIDLCQLPGAERQAEVQRLATEQIQRPFNLTTGPLLRGKLLKLSEQEHILLIAIHHIVGDGWSLGIVIRELLALYQAFSEGNPSPLPDLPIQYADFAVWQRRRLKDEILETQLNYWRQQLKDIPPILELPTVRPRPPVQRYRGARLSFQIPNLTQAYRAIAHQAQSTMFMSLLAAFKILLYRYTGQEDIVVGSPIANRNRAEIEGLIGVFVNTLVLRTDFSGNPTFEELLYRVRKMTIDAYANQDLPFEKLVEELQVERDVNYNPIFQVSFAWQNTPKVKFELPELTITPFAVEHTRALFDLHLDLTETDSGLEGYWEYNTDLFDRSTIERMSKHFQTLLEAIATNPEQQVSQLPLLTPAERHQLLTEWNQTQRDYPQEQYIHQLFEEQVKKTPDAVAIVFEDQQLTYRELNCKANRLANYLRSLGVEPEVLVGICVERSLEMVVGLLGILKAGGAYVPLDPHYPKERLCYMLADSDVELLLTQSSLSTSLPEHQAKVVCLDTDWGAIAQHSQNDLKEKIAQENLAYVIYTSGSTGKPKGVQIRHRSLTNFLNAMHQIGIKEQDILLSVTTLSFDIAALEIFLPLIVGSRLLLTSRDLASDGTRLLEYLVTSKATFMQATPATWQLLLAAGWNEKLQLTVLCGGEALPEQLANQLLERCNSLWNMYGPTETTIWSAASQVEMVNNIASISNPIANTQLYILDRDRQLLPIGVAGELCIGGDGLARGYLHRPDLTAEKFIPHPFSNKPTARLYKTGDLACYLPNGNIKYLGRIDRQVKIRGFRIELGEIEVAIAQHLAVRETVVIVTEESTNSKHLVAYVVPQNEEVITISELRQFLKSKLPNYMVPTALVSLEELPLTPNGKVDRKALPAPDRAESQLERKSIAPRNSIERNLVEIWIEVLDLNTVGIFDNFFELGGDSILAILAITKANQDKNLQLTVKQLFQHQTVADLATVAVPKKREKPKPKISSKDKLSSFPKANLNQKDLDRFLAKVKNGSKNKTI